MYSLRACPCRAYPPGTWFQELCDDDLEFEPHTDIEDARPAKVWIKHSPVCIWKRKNQFPGEPVTRTVGWGPDYLDGAWWVWIEPPPPPATTAPPEPETFLKRLLRFVGVY